MIIVSTVYFATERGLIILVGILAVAALIFFILERVFGVYLWRRPRHEFFRHKRASEAPHLSSQFVRRALAVRSVSSTVPAGKWLPIE